MKKIMIILASITLFLTGCNSSSSKTDQPEHIPVVDQIQRDPFIFSQIIKPEMNRNQIAFEIIHMYDQTISSNDLHFQWPLYIYTSTNGSYEIIEVEYSQLENEDSAFETLLTLDSDMNSEDGVLTIPVQVIPELYKNGYEFPLLNSDQNETMTIGNVTITNITVSENQINFTILKSEDSIEFKPWNYNFSIAQENEMIYPLYSNRSIVSEGINVHLTYAQPIEFPLSLIISRSPTNLPTWNLLFSLIPPSSE